VLVENLSGERIKILRSDRDGEFTSKEIMNFCEEKCIRRFLTVPHSIQQNIVAERKNQIILDMVRSMLKYAEGILGRSDEMCSLLVKLMSYNEFRK
jgi:transposase InsO family protein